MPLFEQSEYHTPDSSFTIEDSDAEDLTPPFPPTASQDPAKEKPARVKDQEFLKAWLVNLTLEEDLRVQRSQYEEVLARCTRLTDSLVIESGKCLDFAKQQASLVEAHAAEKRALVAQIDDMSQRLREQELSMAHSNDERWRAEAEVTNTQETLRVAQKKFEEEKQGFEDERRKWADEKDVTERKMYKFFNLYLCVSGERNSLSYKLEAAGAELDRMRHRQEDDTEAMGVAVKSLQKISDDLRNQRENRE